MGSSMEKFVLMTRLAPLSFYSCLTLSLPVTRICVNYSTVYNDTLVAKGLIGCVLYSRLLLLLLLLLLLCI